MKIFRFSRDGFVAKIQSHHHSYLKELFNPPDLTGLNDYQQKIVLSNWEKQKPLIAELDLNDWQAGIFVFVSELPKSHWIDHELNHLSHKERMSRSWYEAEIEDMAEVWSVYGLVPEMFSAEDYVKRYFVGAACYIPARSLCLIKSVKSKVFSQISRC